jgi:multidrug resistance efflux pump
MAGRSEIWNLDQVNTMIIQNRQRAKELLETLERLESELAAARYRADHAETVAFLSAEGAMELRKQLGKQAAQNNGEEEARTAEAQLRSVRAKLHENKQDLEALMVIGSNLKDERRASQAGYGAGS